MAHEAAVVHESMRDLANRPQAFDSVAGVIDNATVAIGLQASHGRDV